MKYRWAIFFIILIGVVYSAYSSMKKSHQFAENECLLCHVEIEKNAKALKPVSSSICLGCHEDRKQKLSHPVDVPPESPLPADMPLVEDNLSCITCHFVHPFSLNSNSFNLFLLRRPGKGPAFCSACHKISEKGHIVFENVHQGSYEVTDRAVTLDTYSLQCIECHDKHFDGIPGSVGAGTWKHFSKRLNHPVGVSYQERASRHTKKYNQPFMLPKEIRFFDGKIGCGTCHNAYSKEKYMLVRNNRGSKLCLECHIK